MAKRKSVNYPGYTHQNPIPNASRIGNILMSSIMNGTEPGTRNVPPDLASQVVNIFKHIKLCVEAAGGTPDDIIKINFWMKQPSTGRAALWWVRSVIERFSPRRGKASAHSADPPSRACGFDL